MALATQCPHCQTTFRVAHDQLKLRAGLVRCGVCKQIFNGIENLLRPEEADKAFPPAPVPATEPSLQPAAASEPAISTTPETHGEPPAADSPDLAASEESAPVSEQLPEADQPSATTTTPATAPEDAQAAPADPLLRMTLLDIAPKDVSRRDDKPDEVELGEAPTTQGDDGLDKTIDDLQAKPWRSEDTETTGDELDRVDEREYEEPGFVKQARRRQRIGRVLRILMALLLPLLLFGAVVQAAYALRATIAAWFPETRPVLARMCDALHCEVGFPTRIDIVSIESNELQAPVAEGAPYTLNMLLRNRGTLVQAWPNIELTLNDANEKPIARRVFTPRDYLPAGVDGSKGFAARSELQVKLLLDLQDMKAAGYRVYVFYP